MSSRPPSAVARSRDPHQPVTLWIGTSEAVVANLDVKHAVIHERLDLGMRERASA